MDGARTQRGRRLLAGLVVVWAAGTGLTLLVTHDAKAGPPSVPFRQSRHGDAAQLNYLFDDLPAGLRYTSGVGADEATAPVVQAQPAMYARAVYGTSQDPSAPMVSLDEGDTLVAPGVEYLDTLQAQDRHAFTVHGRRTECGRIDLLATNQVGPTQIWCYADTANEQVFATGLHLDMSTMVAIMHGLTIEALEPRLTPEVLPAGMTLLRNEMGLNTPRWATSGVSLAGKCRDAAFLTVGWADEFDTADLGWRYDGWTHVDVNGHPGLLGEHAQDDAHLLVWTADGRSFALEVHGTVDAAALARSLRPATPWEWAALGKQGAPYHPNAATC